MLYMIRLYPPSNGPDEDYKAQNQGRSITCFREDQKGKGCHTSEEGDPYVYPGQLSRVKWSGVEVSGDQLSGD